MYVCMYVIKQIDRKEAEYNIIILYCKYHDDSLLVVLRLEARGAFLSSLYIYMYIRRFVQIFSTSLVTESDMNEPGRQCMSCSNNRWESGVTS